MTILSRFSQVAQKAQETESILTADVSPFSSQGKGNLDRRKSSRPLSEGTTGDDKSAKLDTIEGMKVITVDTKKENYIIYSQKSQISSFFSSKRILCWSALSPCGPDGKVRSASSTSGRRTKTRRWISLTTSLATTEIRIVAKVHWHFPGAGDGPALRAHAVTAPSSSFPASTSTENSS